MGKGCAAERPGSDRETVVFRLGDASYGIDIVHVSQIVKMKEITPCAREGSVMCGIVKVKGKNVPVYDLCAVLEAHRAKQTPKSRIIVTEGENGNAAFVVDAITHVVLDRAAVVDAEPALANMRLI